MRFNSVPARNLCFRRRRCGSGANRNQDRRTHPRTHLFSAVLILVRLAKLKTFACPDIGVWSLHRDSKISYTRLARSLDRINRDPRRRMLDRRLAIHSTFDLWWIRCEAALTLRSRRSEAGNLVRLAKTPVFSYPALLSPVPSAVSRVNSWIGRSDPAAAESAYDVSNESSAESKNTKKQTQPAPQAGPLPGRGSCQRNQLELNLPGNLSHQLLPNEPNEESKTAKQNLDERRLATAHPDGSAPRRCLATRKNEPIVESGQTKQRKCPTGATSWFITWRESCRRSATAAQITEVCIDRRL